jgi:hypothetical protein
MAMGGLGVAGLLASLAFATGQLGSEIVSVFQVEATWAQVFPLGAIVGLLGAAALCLAVVLGWGFAALRAQRRGEVQMDPHALTLCPVDGYPIRILWEQIEAVESDDTSLTITAGGDRIPFDLSKEKVGRVHGLAAEITRRWHNVRQAVDSPEQAASRRAQLAKLVGTTAER